MRRCIVVRGCSSRALVKAFRASRRRVRDVLRTDDPPSYTAYGTGCSGHSGTVLAAAPGQLPWIGQPFTARVSFVPANAPVTMLIGVSNQSWNVQPLPLGLATLGMFGCSLFTSIELTVPVPTVGSTADFSVNVPNDPGLVFSPLFNQAFVLDPGSNAAGAIVSNAAECRIGR